MSELDEVKEQIIHLRMWLNIFVLTDIGLVAWFVTNYGKAHNVLIILDSLAIIGASGLIWVFNRMIEVRIKQLRDL